MTVCKRGSDETAQLEERAWRAPQVAAPTTPSPRVLETTRRQHADNRGQSLVIAAFAALAAACMSAPALPQIEERAFGPVAAADPGSRLPADWTLGPFMQIYVRAYQDSDGDGRGDLRGLVQRLDYLAALGVRGLWLMPVTKSADNDHGYAVTDYRDVEGDYGTLDDMRELLAQAHARGIGVIVDYVMNHSSAEHPAFLHATSRRGAAFADWYVWRADPPSGWRIYGQNPWYPSRGSRPGFYFAGFWDQMPDWNLEAPEVVAWHHDNLRFWLNLGVDGFRFDAVGNLVEHGPDAWENQPENSSLMRDVAALLASYQRRFLVCEAPADPAGFAAACGAAFSFGRQHDMLAAAKGDAEAIAKLAARVRDEPPRLSPFLSNHDSFAGQRPFDQLGGDLGALRLAAATSLLSAGTPFLYYGEEIGMAGAASLTGDPKLRTPMSWSGAVPGAGFTSGVPFRALASNAATHNVEAAMADPASLWTTYRDLIAARRSLPALATGVADLVAGDGNVLRFRRTLGAQQVIVAINYGSTATLVTMPTQTPRVTWTRALPAGGPRVTTDAAGALTLPLAPREVAVLER